MTIDLDERTLLAKERTRLADERNRLANIRTFLAWTRTGLACVGGGLAIIRFFLFQNPLHQMASQTIGSVLVALGILIFILSLVDYWRSYRDLGTSNPYAGSIGFACIVSLVLVFASVLLLLFAFKIG